MRHALRHGPGRRRGTTDPLKPIGEPRWLVIRNGTAGRSSAASFGRGLICTAQSRRSELEGHPMAGTSRTFRASALSVLLS